MSVRSSQRSSCTGSSSRTGSSMRSITSSVALEQLRQLDDVLMRERHAREEAERTLQILQQERAEKDAATRRSEKTERQLKTILSTLNKVLENPDDAKKLRNLQRVAIDGASGGGSATSSERSSTSSDRSASSSQRSGDSSSKSSSSSAQRREAKKSLMVSAGQSALLAAGGGAAVSGKYSASSTATSAMKETFFDKFGLGDERQRRAIDRSYDKTQLRPAGQTSAATSKIPSVLPKGVAPNPALVSSSANPLAKKIDAKNLMNSTVAFTHQKSDLMPHY